MGEHAGGSRARAADLGRTGAANYPELGELLGLAAARETVVAAVPAGARPSALAVSVWTAPAAGVSPAGRPAAGTTPDIRPPDGRPVITPVRAVAGALAVGTLTGIVLAARRRVRRDGDT